MQKALAALLFILTGVCLTVAALTLSTLFDDYKDSPDSTYIETAAGPFLLALLFLVGGIFALRRSPS